ncbi:MAG: winged helix-turn-helix transcriptional regulator [Thermoplasmata archaeon]|nr:winged helix-turn-helix transcriptional regulator [Thermoplasmata archaeon]
MRYEEEDKILQNPNRKQIYNLIKENPGITYSDLRSHLSVKNGTLSHHLTKLQKAGLIVSKKLGIYRRFYPTEGGRAPLEIEEEIKRLLMEHPGMSQSGIASALNVTRQVINYHISRLLKKGQVIVRRSGRSSRIYVRTA